MADRQQIRVLVTGGTGQLGLSLKKTQPESFSVSYAAKATLNIEDSDTVETYVKNNKPNVIINAAAYTKVDLAEKEKDAAFAANEKAVANLAQAAKKHGAFLVHISTDFLFHGSFNRPIDENQMVQPIGIYAQSKAAGERAVAESGAPAAIVRTSWLYSEFNANFMKTMLRLGKEKSELRVIADQHGSPTYAVDLARALWQLVSAPQANAGTPEIFHFSNYGVTTWYDFACAILELAAIETPVLPILTHEYPVPTPRPAYSALWPRKFSERFQWPVRHWRRALSEAISEHKILEG
ncbi:MAG: dTDP-4-dehydrorhamnose reductase [Turneriella sp.]